MEPQFRVSDKKFHRKPLPELTNRKVTSAVQSGDSGCIDSE